MRFEYLIRASLLVLLALSLGGCAPHQMYRDDLTLCSDANPAENCSKNALQEYSSSAAPDDAYVLGFIEFDDQGALWDRNQMDAVVSWTNAHAANEDLLIMVFAHGWKHSAAPNDPNIVTFRDALIGQSRLESTLARGAGRAPRQVVGVYLGWRGASITAPLLEQLTFWERKNTAHKVGSGDVAEVLSRLELIKRGRDSQAKMDEQENGKKQSNTRLVVIGHSFGGAVVYSALSKIFTDRFVHTKGPEGIVSDAVGFGDLVVLLNPAFEAQQAAGLSDMANERATYFQSQLPVLAILTSTGDQATKTAFPIGRWFSTFWQKTRDIERPNPIIREDQLISQKSANRQAVGHFEPYRTHDLVPVGEAAATLDSPLDLRQYGHSSQQWEDDKPGSVIDFGSTKLTRTNDSAGRNPYLFIRVDEEMMRDHNDIDDPRLIEFVRQLIQMTSQDPDVNKRQEIRARVMQYSFDQAQGESQ